MMKNTEELVSSASQTLLYGQPPFAEKRGMTFGVTREVKTQSSVPVLFVGKCLLVSGRFRSRVFDPDCLDWRGLPIFDSECSDCSDCKIDVECQLLQNFGSDCWPGFRTQKASDSDCKNWILGFHLHFFAIRAVQVIGFMCPKRSQTLTLEMRSLQSEQSEYWTSLTGIAENEAIRAIRVVFVWLGLQKLIFNVNICNPNPLLFSMKAAKKNQKLTFECQSEVGAGLKERGQSAQFKFKESPTAT